MLRVYRHRQRIDPHRAMRVHHRQGDRVVARGFIHMGRREGTGGAAAVAEIPDDALECIAVRIGGAAAELNAVGGSGNFAAHGEDAEGCQE